MEVILDCGRMTDREAAHDCLKEVFGLPDYYGRNLDALYDCLSEGGAYRVTLRDLSALTALGEYGIALLDTLREVPGLELTAETEKGEDRTGL